MAQADLARARIADFDVLVAKDFGAAGLVLAYCFCHGCMSPESGMEG